MKKTLLFAVLVGAVCGYVYVFEFKKVNEQEAAEEKSKKIFALAEDEVVQVDLKWVAGETQLKKEGEAPWKITLPIQDLANQEEVGSLLRSAAADTIHAEVDKGANVDKKIFGLDDPLGHVIFTLKNGSQQSLIVGQMEGMNDKKYGWLKETDRVFAMDNFVQTKYVKSARDLRDKHIVRTSIDKLKALTISGAGKPVELVKDGELWLYKNSDWSVDQEAVGTYLGRIRDLLASEFVSEDKASAESKSRFQTGKKVFEVEIVTDEGARESLVEHGKKDANSYVTSSLRPTVYTTATSLLEGLRVKPDHFRSKKAPFHFDKSKIERIEIRTELTKTELLKDGQEWKETNPAGDPIDQGQVGRLLELASQLSAAEFLGRKDIGQTLGQIVFKTKEGATEFEMKWGRELSSDNRIAMTNKLGEAVAVNKTSISSLPIQTLRQQKPKAGEVQVKEVPKSP